MFLYDNILDVFEKMVLHQIEHYKNGLDIIRILPEPTKFVCIAQLKAQIRATLTHIDEFEEAYLWKECQKHDELGALGSDKSKYTLSVLRRLAGPRSKKVLTRECLDLKRREQAVNKVLLDKTIEREELAQKRFRVCRSCLNQLLSKVNVLIENP